MMARFRRDKGPDGPTDIGRGGWWAALKRTVHEFREDNLTDWAAALTYYGVLAIFPALIVLVSILGLVGESATQPLLDELGKVAPGPGQGHLHERDQEPPGDKGAAGRALRRRPRRRALVGLRLRRRLHARVQRDLRHGGGPADLEDAARARRHDDRAAPAPRRHRARRGPDGRARQSRSATSSASAAPRSRSGTSPSGPCSCCIVSLMFALLYWAAPNVKQPGFRWVSPGGILAVVGLADRVGRVRPLRRELRLVQQDLRRARRRDRVPGLALDLEHRRSCSGAEFNAELERERAIEAGMRPRTRSRSWSRATRARWRSQES